MPGIGKPRRENRLVFAKNWGCWERMQSDCWWEQGFFWGWWKHSEIDCGDCWKQTKKRAVKNTTQKVPKWKTHFFFNISTTSLLFITFMLFLVCGLREHKMTKKNFYKFLSLWIDWHFLSRNKQHLQRTETLPRNDSGYRQCLSHTQIRRAVLPITPVCTDSDQHHVLRENIILSWS